MLLSFLILFGVIDVVYKPLTHIVHMNSTKINDIVEESYNVELTSFFVDEVAKNDSEVLSLDESGLKKHESIMYDAQKIVDYYNEHCLEDGDSKIDVTVFKELNSDSVKVLKDAMQKVMLNEYADNDKISTFANTDFYCITSDEKKELEALESDEEKDEYRREHSLSTYTTSALSTAVAHYGAYKVSDEDNADFQATSSMQKELYSLERYGTVTDKYNCADAYRESVPSRSQGRTERTLRQPQLPRNQARTGTERPYGIPDDTCSDNLVPYGIGADIYQQQNQCEEQPRTGVYARYGADEDNDVHYAFVLAVDCVYSTCRCGFLLGDKLCIRYYPNHSAR